MEKKPQKEPEKMDPKCREDLPTCYVNRVLYDEVSWLGIIIVAGNPEVFEPDASQYYEQTNHEVQVERLFLARNAKR